MGQPIPDGPRISTTTTLHLTHTHTMSDTVEQVPEAEVAALVQEATDIKLEEVSKEEEVAGEVTEEAAVETEAAASEETEETEAATECEAITEATGEEATEEEVETSEAPVESAE